MDLSEKILDKKEELLDEFENLSLEDVAKKIKNIENRDDDLIFKWYSSDENASIKKNKVSNLLKNFKYK